MSTDANTSFMASLCMGKLTKNAFSSAKERRQGNGPRHLLIPLKIL